jgi:hypothetical protein
MPDDSPTALPVIDRIIAEATASPEAARAATIDVRVGPYWTVVRSSVGAGLAATMAHAHEHSAAPIGQPGSLHRLPPVVLAERLRSASAPEAAVGLAAVNALLAGAAAEAVDGNARELLYERAEGRLLAVIGHFPFTDRLRAVCRTVGLRRAGRMRPGDLESAWTTAARGRRGDRQRREQSLSGSVVGGCAAMPSPSSQAAAARALPARARFRRAVRHRGRDRAVCGRSPGRGLTFGRAAGLLFRSRHREHHLSDGLAVCSATALPRCPGLPSWASLGGETLSRPH